MTSPLLNRRLTGSKGVGRLAVQFLASELELTSVPNEKRLPERSTSRELFAMVNWNTAVQAGELTQATALYELRQPDNGAFPLKRAHGTKVTLKGLTHEWNAKEFKDLAREIWFLQPPFRSLTGTSDIEDSSFEVDLRSPDPDAVACSTLRWPEYWSCTHPVSLGDYCGKTTLTCRKSTLIIGR